MKLSLWKTLRGQFNKLPPVVAVDLTGKTVVVLGANTGIGFEAASHFASMKPGRIILGCRSQERGQRALEKLKGKLNGDLNIELWLIDLADFESVKRFADRFEQDGGRLDILVANAAVATLKYEASQDGWEKMVQVNSLATPLITLLLLPRMLQTALEHATVPRIVVVSSDMHHYSSIPEMVLRSDNILTILGSAEFCIPKRMQNLYGITKILNILFVRALSERLGVAPLIVSTPNPGLCVSELRRDSGSVLAFIYSIVERIMAFTAEEGSRSLIFSAVGQPGNPDALRGQYINQSHVEEPSDFIVGTLGRKAQDQTWDELIEIVGKVDPRVLQTVKDHLSGA
ncbi:hypothetical protein C8R46DRAFT_1066138 [Mycena filopes]|nr:hypothetical protein C8R46DRAFT_1066138 [Mycena filopes]